MEFGKVKPIPFSVFFVNRAACERGASHSGWCGHAIRSYNEGNWEPCTAGNGKQPTCKLCSK